MVAPLRIGFFGTPEFALPTLARLQASIHDLALIVTQPDRPRGRGHHLVAGPVKAFAIANGVPVLQPERLRDEGFVAEMSNYQLDLAIVAAYGKILPKRILDLPARGMLNVHASLLPRWRGAAPVHRAILAGDAETGVTIMRVVPALDAGPMLAKVALMIGPNETSGELERRLAESGADLLLEAVNAVSASGVPEEAQNEGGVTYAHRLERAESQVDWARPAIAVHNQIRGLQPWPLAVVGFRGRRLALLGSVVADDREIELLPGTVCAIEPNALVVAASPGAVRVTRVQLEGKAPMSVDQFQNGHHVAVGERLDPPGTGG